MVLDLWIVEKKGGRCLFHKSYGPLKLDPDLLSSFLAGLNAFSEAELGEAGIESIEMGHMKWVYINWENSLLLVVASDRDTDSAALKHQLDVVRKHFMEYFKIDKAYLEKFDGNASRFPQFEPKLDELVNDWEKESKVVDIAQMMNLLEVYQQILHAFTKVFPAIKTGGKIELTKKMSSVKYKLPKFFENISYGKDGWSILGVDVTSPLCREGALRNGLNFILKSFIEEMKNIFEDMFFEIAKKLVYPKLLADWTRIRDLGIDSFLLELFLT